MRTIPEILRPRLAGPVTTLARAWRLTRTDGLVLGFTDHDAALEFDGTRFEAATGLVAGEAESALGLAAGTQDVEGALSSAAITEADIAAGRLDGARVETFVVDWLEPQAYLLTAVSVIGEIRRSGPAFTAELRGIEAMLDRERGRLYQRRCDAALGDGRCGVDLSASGRSVAATIVEATPTTLLVSTPDGFDPGLFLRGTVQAGDGVAGEIVEISAGDAGGEWRLQLAVPFAAALAPGGAIHLSAGCDKSFASCRGRFANSPNFRGFPHLPGLDTALKVGKADALHDGAPVVP